MDGKEYIETPTIEEFEIMLAGKKKLAKAKEQEIEQGLTKFDMSINAIIDVIARACANAPYGYSSELVRELEIKLGFIDCDEFMKRFAVIKAMNEGIISRSNASKLYTMP